jgi:NAD-dependent DNA ligase
MSNNPWARQAVLHKNEFSQSAGQLVGIVTGLIANAHLDDDEIRFLRDWIATHDEVRYDWPGNIVAARLTQVLSDGVISDDERAHLLATLQSLIGGSPETLTQATHVTELVFDDVETIVFEGRRFCLTGNFVYAPRPACEQQVIARGGLTVSGVSKKVSYVVVGSLGSQEWKHGSYGTKIEKAMQLKQAGAPLVVVKEDAWAAAL